MIIQTTPSKPRRMIGYIRVSTDKQDDSPTVQRETIMAACRASGLDLVDIVEDVGVSGGVPFHERVGGRHAMERLERGEGDGLIFAKLDRAFRNVADCLMCIDGWTKQGYTLHICNFANGRALDTSDPMQRLLVSMLGVFADFEKNLIRSRTKTALQSRKTRGKAWNHPPFGYMVDGGALVQNPVEYGTVAEVLALHDAGLTPHAIARRLSTAGRPNRSGKPSWQCGQVQRILTHAQQKAA